MPPGLTLARSFGCDVAADCIGNTVDGAEPCDGCVVGEINRFNGAQGLCFDNLALAYAGDDLRADLLCGEECAAAHAADSSGEKDGLAGLHGGGVADELVASDGDERDGGGDGHFETVWDLWQAARL